MLNSIVKIPLFVNQFGPVFKQFGCAPKFPLYSAIVCIIITKIVYRCPAGRPFQSGKVRCMAQNKILLSIADLNILVSTAEEESYVKTLAQDLDADIRGILESNSGASVTNAALLCAIDYLDSFRKASRSSNNLRTQIKEYLADAAAAKLQYDEEKKKNDELSVEIGALRTHLTRIAAEADQNGIVERLKADLAGAVNEINLQKKHIADLLAQNNALNEKSNAMSEYISGQDQEIGRLSDLCDGYTARIAELEQFCESLMADLDASRKACAEKDAQIDRMVSAASQPAPEPVPAPEPQTEPARDLFDDAPEAHRNENLYFDLDASDSIFAAPLPDDGPRGYDDGMPDLNWTKDI